MPASEESFPGEDRIHDLMDRAAETGWSGTRDYPAARRACLQVLELAPAGTAGVWFRSWAYQELAFSEYHRQAGAGGLRDVREILSWLRESIRLERPGAPHSVRFLVAQVWRTMRDVYVRRGDRAAPVDGRAERVEREHCGPLRAEPNEDDRSADQKQQPHEAAREEQIQRPTRRLVTQQRRGHRIHQHRGPPDQGHGAHSEQRQSRSAHRL